MIIGKGQLAQTFLSYSDDPSYVVFASGVSDSTNTDEALFLREEMLLSNTIESFPNKSLIYFSSCDVGCSHTEEIPYYKHKAHMEKIVTESAAKYYIFRLPQVVGKTGNPKNLMNFFVHAIQHEIPFRVFENTFKNILDIDDVFKICDFILKGKHYQNSMINIVNSNYYLVEEIVKTIEGVLGKKACYSKMPYDKTCRYDHTLLEEIISQIDVTFDKMYLENLIRKYYHTV